MATVTGIEVWLKIESAPRYSVSSHGRVRNDETGIILKPHFHNTGYYRVTLSGPTKAFHQYVHRLVAIAFFDGDYPDLIVNHIDGNKIHNFVGNLEWSTYSENSKHAYRTGLRKPIISHRRTPIRIVETGEIFASQQECAETIGGRASTITDCLQGRRKRHRGYTYEYV